MSLTLHWIIMKVTSQYIFTFVWILGVGNNLILTNWPRWFYDYCNLLTSRHDLHDQFRVGNICTASRVSTHLSADIWVHTCHLICAIGNIYSGHRIKYTISDIWWEYVVYMNWQCGWKHTIILQLQSTLDISKLWGLFFTSSNYPKCKLIWTSKKSPTPIYGWKKRSKCIYYSDRRFEVCRIRDIRVRDIENPLYIYISNII